MTRARFNAFCATLAATGHVVQWGGADVWKVGAKVFAIGVPEGRRMLITFKVTPMGYELLRAQPGLRPAPYLASRGFTWIQHYDSPGLRDTDLRAYLQDSHRIVALGLSRRQRMALGLAES
jgi:predicted DNA-binding protein (MmcQ/YjbR family)